MVSDYGKLGEILAVCVGFDKVPFNNPFGVAPSTLR
jgi:hypothetical protein